MRPSPTACRPLSLRAHAALWQFISVSFHTHRLRKGTRLRAVIPALIVLLLLVAALAAVSGCALSGDGGTGGTDSTSATGREEVTLLSVADGDTITVRTAGGAKEKIRYIGMDAPEMAGDGEPAEPFALEAAAFNRGLVTGRDLRLKRGVEKRDDYGRLLGYIYAGDIFVNREMVRTGYARAHAYPPNLKYQKEIDAAETEARRERVGIWGLAPDGGPDNGGNAGGAGSSGGTESGAAGTGAGVVPWSEAAGHVGESVTVEGPVVGTHWARGNSGAPTFLNVGRKYPEPRRFTVLIWGQDRSQFPAPPDQRYYGRTIRITGIVEMYEGAPEMVISSPGQIEIVD